MNDVTLIDNLPKIRKALQSALSAAVAQAANDIAATAKDKIESSSPVGPTEASEPGAPPANRTGELAESIEVQSISAMESKVVVGALYGVILEYGSVDMAPRPFLNPSVAEVKPQFEKALRSAVNRANK